MSPSKTPRNLSILYKLFAFRCGGTPLHATITAPAKLPKPGRENDTWDGAMEPGAQKGVGSMSDRGTQGPAAVWKQILQGLPAYIPFLSLSLAPLWKHASPAGL